MRYQPFAHICGRAREVCSPGVAHWEEMPRVTAADHRPPVKSLRPTPKSTRGEIWDSREPGLGLRISDREDRDPQRRGKAAKITLQLYARFQGDAARAAALSASMAPSAWKRRGGRQASRRA